MRPLYIFDIDGTICNIEHRLYFLENKTDPERWKKFYRACKNDAPNLPVITTLELLRQHADIWFFSGRSEEVRYETCLWLHVNTTFKMDQLASNPEWLTMRRERDYTEDDVLKQSWLDNLLTCDRERLVAVFDDRKRVVDMWRANGVPCFQVANGEF